MARLSTPHARTTSPRARWIVVLACALGAAAVVVLLWPRPAPVLVSAAQPAPPPPGQARPAPPSLSPEPRTEPEPARPAAPAAVPARTAASAAELHLGSDGVLAIPLVVPMHASTIPEVRIPAGTRGVRLLIDVPIPSSLDGLSVSVRGPEGRVPARLTRTGGSHGLTVELDGALQAGVHEVLVTNDDETTLAHHRIRALPAGAAPDSASSP